MSIISAATNPNPKQIRKLNIPKLSGISNMLLTPGISPIQYNKRHIIIAPLAYIFLNIPNLNVVTLSDLAGKV